MKEVKEISLLDMCFYILSKWKIMIAAALLGAVVVGTVSYLNSYKQYKDAQSVVKTENAPTIDLTEDEIQALEAKIAVINEYEQDIAEYDYYLENSIRAKLNPNKFYRGSVNYYFEGGEENAKAKVFCEEEILKESNYEELALRLTEETDAALIKEVVSFKQNDENGRFSIVVEHYDKNECSIMLDFFEEKMKSAEEMLEAQGISADIQKVSSDIKTVNDYELVELSTNINNKRAAAYDNVSALEAKMTDVQKAYYMRNYGENGEKVTDTTETAAKPGVNIKLTAVGVIMGLFFVICIFGVRYLFSDRVHTKEEMESWLSLPVYEYEVESNKKVNFIDSTLNSVRKSMMAKSAETPEMIAQMIAIAAKQTNEKKIYFTGRTECVNSEVIKKIMTEMAAEDFEVMIGSSLLGNVEALKMAEEYGCMVLVEKCNVSQEKNIRQEIVKANTCGIKVLGVILED